MEQKLTKQQIELLKNLDSDSEQQSLKAIEDLRNCGGEFAVEPLMDKFFSTTSDEIKTKIGKLIVDIKSSTVGDIIGKNILKYENKDKLNIFLGYLWESSLNFTDLQPFVKLLFSENIQTSIESSTIIEENLHKINEENKDLCLKYLKEHSVKDNFQKNIIEMVKGCFEI